ncbi:replication stress response regulator SDE2 [Oryza brachyantha]|uniref:replication stress response regulator SDE2 n=1 Tax=Oryza brachyantha TaxID=4533 RepID=UPI001ADBD4B4|nr:replication stress response regulator SDE2 [Oryza brachyantha]
MAEANQYQILVRLLDGRTRCLRFSTPTVSGAAILDAVSALSRIPAASLRLVTGRLDVSPSSVLAASSDGQFPSAFALLRLRGGKGGFGSLLRGAASKAGQKKTSNFDACRDINGRRLRHVNAERRLEEWKAEAADRQLEKLAEDFIKKKAKETGRAGVRAAEVDKYLEKYRKDAESCVNAVEESVRASLGKRKTVTKPRSGEDAKKLKIWLGKKKVEEDESDSDSDSEMGDDEGADTKSIILDDENSSHGSKSEDEKVDLGSVIELHSERETSGEKSACSDSDENGNCVQESMEPTIRSEGACGDFVSDCAVEREVGLMDQHTPENVITALSEEVLKPDIEAEDNTASTTSHLNGLESPPVEEPSNGSRPLSEEPLDLTNYSSAAELEVVGMEKLKLELQTRGLKCGGTLQERSARLFLLKTTPLEKLPKKLFAKPSGGGK